MEYRKITKEGFESWYDTGMTLAKFYVKVWQSSNHFLLQDYAGKDEFYTLMQEKMESFRTELGSVEHLSGVVYYAKEIKRIFAQHLQKSTLTLERSWKLLYALLLLIDVKSGKEELNDWTIRIANDAICDVGKVKYKETTISPFVTTTGIFGTNTYLYCYYFGIHLASCTITPLPTHERWITGFENACHDLDHESRVAPSRRRLAVFQTVYDYAFSLPDYERKLVISTLFLTIHESDYNGRVLLPTDDFEKFIDHNYNLREAHHAIHEHYPPLLKLGFNPSLSENIVAESIKLALTFYPVVDAN